MQKCTEDRYCLDRLNNQLEWEFESWTKTFDLVCDKAVNRRSGATLAFSTNTVIFFIMTTLADIIGRQKAMFMGVLIIWVGMIGMYFVPNYLFKLPIFGLATGCDGTFTSLFVLEMNEISSKKHR